MENCKKALTDMRYIYCPSFIQLSIACQQLILGYKVTIISNNPTTIEAAANLNIPVVKIENILDKHYLNPIKIQQFSKKIQNSVKSVGENLLKGEFIFSIVSHDFFGLDLVKYLISFRDDIKILYFHHDHDSYLNEPKIIKFYTIKMILKWIYYNYIYSSFLVYKKKYGEENALYVTNQFLNNSKINKLNISKKVMEDSYWEYAKKINLSPLGSVYFIGDYSIESQYKYFNKMELDELLLIIKNNSQNIFYKPKLIEFNCKQFENWKIENRVLPSEILCCNSSLVIATVTSAMNLLAKKGVKCISIARIISDRHPIVDEYINKMIQDSDNKITFVTSKEELIELLKLSYM